MRDKNVDPAAQSAFLLLDFASKYITDILEQEQCPRGTSDHISIVAMAFKCQPGLDTCVTVTPGAHPYTSFNKHRAPASFVIQEQCMVSRESRDERRRAPSGRALDAELACPACTFLSPASLPLSPGKRFWRGTDHAEPNPSYLAEDHTDGPD